MCAIQNISPSCSHLWWALERVRRKSHVRCENIMSVDSGIEIRQTQDRAAKCSRSHQQNDGQGDLEHHKTAVEATRVSRDRARSSTQGLFQFARWRTQCRGQSKEQTAD